MRISPQLKKNGCASENKNTRLQPFVVGGGRGGGSAESEIKDKSSRVNSLSPHKNRLCPEMMLFMSIHVTT